MSQLTVDPLWWADPQLKARLEKDPQPVLRERGVNVPPGLPQQVVYDVLRIVSLMWVNGRVVPLEKFYIDPQDEGLLFGRGVWESTRTINSVPWLWQLHLDRMRRTAIMLGMDLPPERLPDEQQVAAFVRSVTTQDVIVRLNASAGRPGMPGVVWMSMALRPLPQQSVRLQTQRSQVLFRQPILAGKTFHYAFRLQTSAQASQAGFDTALMLDANDNVLEASHANIVMRFEDGWATPSNEAGLFLPGTVRAHLLQNAPVKIREMTIPKARLADVKEAFLTNSNVGLVPVTQIDDRNYPVGTETLNLQRWLQPDVVAKNPITITAPQA